MITPAHIIRGYIWDLVKANTSMTEINGIVPVLPVQDEALVTTTGKPYMIYAYVEDPNTSLREIGGGLFVIRALSNSYSELSDIVTVIIRGFEMEDDSAANINLWSSDNTDYDGVRFIRTFIQYADGGIPTTEEGGKIEAVINIRFEYVTRNNVKIYDGTDWT